MIIVTGGAGFIGSNLIAGLEALGVGDIVVCDRFGQDDKWKNIAKREIRDLVAPENLFEYLEGHVDEIDAVFHLGAISYTTEKDTDAVINTNFAYSRALWKWCAKNDARFFYTSSYSTYGTGHSLSDFSDDDKPEKLAQLRPLNPYGWSKHQFDRRVSRVVHGQNGHVVSENIPKQWVGFKLFNVYGPNEYHKGEHQSVIAQMYPQISAGAAAKLFRSNNPDYEDGKQVRDYISVEDCVNVMLWFYQNPDKSGLYNVGTGEARTFEDMANAMFAACDKTPKITYTEMPESLEDKYQYFTQADISKLREAGYDKAFTSLEDGVRDFVKKHLSQDDVYK
jgi:ADP-L-glycero-D-manno-heptose 6-epimerase